MRLLMKFVHCRWKEEMTHIVSNVVDKEILLAFLPKYLNVTIQISKAFRLSALRECDACPEGGQVNVNTEQD